MGWLHKHPSIHYVVSTSDRHQPLPPGHSYPLLLPCFDEFMSFGPAGSRFDSEFRCSLLLLSPSLAPAVSAVPYFRSEIWPVSASSRMTNQATSIHKWKTRLLRGAIYVQKVTGRSTPVVPQLTP